MDTRFKVGSLVVPKPSAPYSITSRAQNYIGIVTSIHPSFIRVSTFYCDDIYEQSFYNNLTHEEISHLKLSFISQPGDIVQIPYNLETGRLSLSSGQDAFKVISVFRVKPIHFEPFDFSQMSTFSEGLVSAISSYTHLHPPISPSIFL